MSRSDNSGMPRKHDIHPRTWVEISRSAALQNSQLFRDIVGDGVHFWAVVKSNAYGHGIFAFPDIVKNICDGFCVDSLVEACTLRKEGIELPILIIGPTHPEDFSVAAEQGIIVSVSTHEDITALEKADKTPRFHIKIDTGFHRRGFYLEDIPEVIKRLPDLNDRKYAISDIPNAGLTGIYTHFSSANDSNDVDYTDRQFNILVEAYSLFEQAGFSKIMRHCAATSATLMDNKYHLDAVRIGIGLYGLWPSQELALQGGVSTLHPALSWRAIISEIKSVKKGDCIGYNCSEHMTRDGKIAVLPIGYWFGLPRGLSRIGEVLISDKRAKILGNISMDLVVVDVTDIPCDVGDTATIIGRDRDDKISAYDVAQKLNTIHYEVTTRINPLIERRIVE